LPSSEVGDFVEASEGLVAGWVDDTDMAKRRVRETIRMKAGREW
jgi:hypothetical protein